MEALQLIDPTVRHMLGDVKGNKKLVLLLASLYLLYFKTILDLGCRDGIRTTMMKKLGAYKTVGVDISSGINQLLETQFVFSKLIHIFYKEVIDTAIKEAQKSNVDVEFIVGDCTQVKSYGEFDILTVQKC